MEPAEDSTGLSSWANVTELSISPICSMMPSDTAMRNHSVIDHKITALRIIDKIGHFPWSHPYLGLSQIRRNLNRIFGVVRPVTRYNWRPACRNGLPKQRREVHNQLSWSLLADQGDIVSCSLVHRR